MPPENTAQAYAEIAQLLIQDGKYNEAIKTLEKAEGVLEDNPNTTLTSAMVLRSKSEALICAARADDALIAFERYLLLQYGSASDTGEAIKMSLLSPKDLCRLHYLSEYAVETLAESNNHMFSRNKLRKESVDELLLRGPWNHPQQLPAVMVSGLSNKPWLSVESDFPHLSFIPTLLSASTNDLIADLRQLRRRGLLLPQDECISDASTGYWSWFNPNGYWLPDLDDDGCSVETPGACDLLSQLTSSITCSTKEISTKTTNRKPLRVLRASFSVLGGGTHLRAHCGPNNSRLKFHLGLETPVDPFTGEPCAFLRVGNETREWKRGSVLFFDDSFEHEAWNNCKGKKMDRSVFQLVISHPDLLNEKSERTSSNAH